MGLRWNLPASLAAGPCCFDGAECIFVKTMMPDAAM